MAKPELEGRFVESTPEQVRATEQALVPYTGAAAAPPELAGQPGKYRVVTKVWLGLIAASIASIVVGGEAPMIIGALGLVFFIPCLLLTGINDMLQPSPRGRRTPVDALKCYFRAVRWQRWKAAFAALGRPARETEVTVPKIRALESERDTLTITNPKQLKRYWNTLSRPSKGMNRRMTGFDFEPLGAAGGDVRRFRVTVDLKAHSQSSAFWWGVIGQLASTKKFHTAFEVYVYRHKSQWWLYSGELGLPQRVKMLTEEKIVE